MAKDDLDTTQWQRHVARWRAGRLTVPAYCEAHGLALAAMRYQIRRQPASVATVPLVRIERATDAVAAPAPTAGTGEIVIEVGRARVRVEAGVDGATLATVLTALGAVR